MTWAASQPPSVPTPQRYYRINATALTWGELWRCSGNPLLFIATLPLLPLAKLFRIPLLSGELFPEEIRVEAVDPPALAQRDKVDRLVQSIELLGFRRFGTFRLLGPPQDAVAFALLNRWEKTYATVGHLTSAMKTTVGCDFSTGFRDGGELTTTDQPMGAALVSPPQRRRQLLAGAPPERLWAAHRALVAEIAPWAGGVSGQVGHQHYVDGLCHDWRVFCDFHTARGVFVPAGAW